MAEQHSLDAAPDAGPAAKRRGERAVFVEDLEPSELLRPAVVKLLVDHGLAPIVSVRPWNVTETLEARVALERAGLPVTLWPMLDDAAGRWVNVRTVAAMRPFVQGIADAARTSAPALPLRVLLDLEPPIDDVRKVINGRSVFALARLAGILAAPGGTRELAALVGDLRQRKGEVSAAVVPFVLADGPLGGVSRLLGVKTSRAACDPAWIMAYSTLFAGYSRGYVDRARALGLVKIAARRARQRFGTGAALALGCVGTGALGDEAVYRDHEELAADVAVAVREGIERLALFDLKGVLGRAEPERWLGAFVG